MRGVKTDAGNGFAEVSALGLFVWEMDGGVGLREWI